VDAYHFDPYLGTPPSAATSGRGSPFIPLNRERYVNEQTKQFDKLKKRLRKAKKYAADRVSRWSQTLIDHVLRHGRPLGR